MSLAHLNAPGSGALHGCTDRRDAERFLQLLDPTAQKFAFQTFSDNPARKSVKGLARTFHGSLSDRWVDLEKLSAAGAGIFVTVNETDLLGRSAANIKRVRAFFIDMDVPPSEGAFSRLQLRPHMATMTGPSKCHLYWLVTGALLEEFKPIQKRLADLFGSDPAVCDLPRVMRLPGFMHQKDPEKPFLVRLLQNGAAQAISFEHFTAKVLEAESNHRTSIAAVGVASRAAKGIAARVDFEAGCDEGQRHNELMRRAGSCAGMKLSEEDALSKCRDWNERNRPPLDDTEIEQAVAYVYRKENENRQPIASLPVKTSGFGVAASELVAKSFQPIRWLVPGVLPEGLTLLAGKAKQGKSWLMLNCSIAIATGGTALGTIKCQQGDVLALCLEDNERRLKDRLIQLLGSPKDAPNKLTLATTWPALDDGGLQKIEEWAKSIQSPALVVVDVLARVRPKTDIRKALYDNDYAAMQGLQDLAGRLRIAIVVVTHLRKAPSDDPFDEVSGTTGLTGAADSTLILRREKGRADAVLYGRGRDLHEFEKALQFDKQTGLWRLLGEAYAFRNSELEAAIIEALIQAQIAIGPKAVADSTGEGYAKVKMALSRMAKAGKVKANGGKYAPL